MIRAAVHWPMTLGPVLCLILALAWAGSGGQAHAAEFLSVAEDIPLAKGLKEARQGSLVFDSAAGRIIESEASGAVPPDDVRAFYLETLPQLGWSRVAGSADGGTFEREGERLTLLISAAPGGGAHVRFRLSSAGLGP